MKINFTTVLTSIFFIMYFALNAIASIAPDDLTGDILWDEDAGTTGEQTTYAGEAEIIAAFNNARRAEEVQLGLAANTLGTLTLPAGFSALSDVDRYLYLMNAELAARDGVDYGSGAVCLVGLEAEEAGLTTLAQTSAEAMSTSGVAQMITDNYDCTETSRAQRVAFLSTGPILLPIERAVYFYIYDMSSRTGLMTWMAAVNDNTVNTGTEPFFGLGTFDSNNGTFNRTDITLTLLDPSLSGCSFVPVELSSFTAKVEANEAVLEWITASEFNNAGFEVERSKDGTTWEMLGFVKGAGTTVETQRYKYIDQAPLAINYYRLKQVDNDDTVTYSEIAVVELDVKASDLSVFPNPTVDIIEYQLSNADLEEAHTVFIYDWSGRMVRQYQQTSDNVRAIDMSDLNTGTYNIVVSGDTWKYTKVIIKQ